MGLWEPSRPSPLADEIETSDISASNACIYPISLGDRDANVVSPTQVEQAQYMRDAGILFSRQQPNIHYPTDDPQRLVQFSR